MSLLCHRNSPDFFQLTLYSLRGSGWCDVFFNLPLAHQVVQNQEGSLEICVWNGHGNLSPPSTGAQVFIFPLARAGMKPGSNRVCVLPSNVLFWCWAYCCNSLSTGHSGACRSRTEQTEDSPCVDDSALLLSKVLASLSHHSAKTEAILCKVSHK